MILFKTAFMKVWKVDKKDNYIALNVSTSDKQQDGTYKNSNWNVRLVGKAKELEVVEGSRIKVVSGKVENIYDKDKQRSWLNVIVFDAELQTDNNQSDALESDLDELPF